MEFENTTNIVIFVWKLARNTLPTRGKLRNLGMIIDCNCPFYHKAEKNIDHIFKSCDFAIKYLEYY